MFTLSLIPKNVSVLLCLACVVSINTQTSILDKFIQPFRLWRQSLHRTLESNENRARSLIEKQNKLQVIADFEFPCDLSNVRSAERPTSVHKLRPGDVDVIGAMGDSLTAGFGIFAHSIGGALVENRGASFSIGGEESWRKYLTIPNILKNFNPNLIGFSLATSLSIDRRSQFNVAEGGAISDNMPYMAKILVKRILNDARVDVKNDWKMITLMIGPNDFCSEICFYNNPEKLLAKHKNDIVQVLRTLRDYLPRTIVNYVPAMHAHLLKQMNNKSPLCAITHSFECPCVFGLVHQKRVPYYKNLIDRWINMDVQIANYEEFQRDDFAVISQQFTINMSMPFIGNQFDYSAVSTDCFHFSQKGQAIAANALWNNILEPVGAKKRLENYNLFKTFNCPTRENPYIFTNRNSILVK